MFMKLKVTNIETEFNLEILNKNSNISQRSLMIIIRYKYLIIHNIVINNDNIEFKIQNK